ncbi:MAG: binding-protein-dependent transport system inner rane protein [Chloroflexi bacterium]|nr:binding-protein-dependent transport system inner rane protein [Chloroflexota bacterium]MDB5076251.1 binding-protein-dependent transport system inner rane protein [Chloroflexota bacterium]
MKASVHAPPEATVLIRRRRVRPTRWATVRHATQFVLGDRALAPATLLLLALVVLAIFGPLVWSKDSLGIDIGNTLQAPTVTHPMGTDGVGRDILARFIGGARISLLTGLVVVLAGATLGSAIGVMAGYYGRWVDAVLMRIMDAILAFPPLILAMAVTVGLGVGVTTAAIGITLTSVPFYARLLRSEVVRLRTLPFVEAASALGATQRRIILRHIVPHLSSTLLVQAASVFGYAVLSLAALGFVGLGAQVPTPEWGSMITDGMQYTLTGQWWIGVFPGLGLLVAVTATSLISDRLRDILDPRGQARG